MKLAFLGAAGTVTGSRYLVEAGGRRILIDCGLFQGYKMLRLRNWAAFPVSPASIDAVILTHAHLDHSGYVPRLVRQGFSGPVYASPATCDLARLLLPDSGRLQEEEASYHGKKGTSKHKPALALYTEDDAWQALKHFRHLPAEGLDGLAEHFDVAGVPVGHLLGALAIRVTSGGKSILFSGDVGRPDDLLMRPPADPLGTDWLVVESTYGDRKHPVDDVDQALADVVNRTVDRGGAIVVPAFAVGRAQALLHVIARLKHAGRIADVPVFLDSPMAIDATEIYHRHRSEHRLSVEECRRLCHGAKFIRTIEESRRLNASSGPRIIISASGMATGGRVLHHLRRLAPDPRNTILFGGHQAGGTRGALMVAGAAEVRIFGEPVKIAAEVIQLASLSGHADADQLLAWLARSARPPARVFVTHGDPQPADALRRRIENELRWHATVPEHGQTETLE